jgi:hypothetical protein
MRARGGEGGGGWELYKFRTLQISPMYGKVLSRGSLKMLRMYHWGGALQFWKASPSRPSPIHKVGREGGKGSLKYLWDIPTKDSSMSGSRG